MIMTILFIVFFILAGIFSYLLWKASKRELKLASEYQQLILEKTALIQENAELESSCTKLIERAEDVQKNADDLYKSVQERDDIIDTYERFIDRFSTNLSLVDDKLKEIDTNGSFSSDDELGYVFKAVSLMMSNLQEFNINNAKKKEE